MKIACRINLFLFFILFVVVKQVGAETLVVLKNSVNLRESASVNSAVLVRLNTGQEVEELQKSGRWYEVRLVGASETTGWIFESMVGPVLTESIDDTPVVATMGDISLSLKEMTQFIDLLDSSSQKKLRKQPELMKRVVEEEIVRKVIINKAMASGLYKDPIVMQFMERAKKQALAGHFLSEKAKVASDYPPEDEVRQVYQAMISKYTTPAQVHLAQIFIATPHDADASVEKEGAAKAKELAEMARRDGADFAEMAKEYSEHKTTAKSGGDLGWVRRDSLLPEMKEAVNKLTVNDVSEPVRTLQGWHIFRLLEEKAEVVRPLSEVDDEIRELLRNNKHKENREAYLQTLMTEMPVSVDVGTLLEGSPRGN